MKSHRKFLYTALLLATALLVLFSRRPETLTHAQFWAEDGRVWYANAYNLGVFKSFFTTQDGYFQTLSRIIAGASLAVNLKFAPLIFNLTALIIQLLPVLLLLSGRFDRIIPSKKLQLLLCFLYLALPNTAEVSGNLTNAQWFLALTACLIILADAGGKKAWKIFDVFFVALSGLSGPFSIFLFPMAFLRWFKTRKTWAAVLALVTFACGIIQAAGLLFFTHSSRLHTFPLIMKRLFFAILNRQVFLGSTIGVNAYLWFLVHTHFYYSLFMVTCLLGLIITAYAFWKGSLEIRLFIVFGGLVFLASLFNPTVADKTIPAWKLLSRSIAGARYWLIPMLAFLSVLIWSVRKANPLAIRVIASVFLVGMAFGIVMDWEYSKFIDYHFAVYAENFENAPKGEQVSIPINPVTWDMELIKH